MTQKSDTFDLTVSLELKADLAETFWTDIVPAMLSTVSDNPLLLSVRVLQDRSDRCRALFIDRFKDEESAERYFAERAASGAQDALAKFLAKPPRIEKWLEVASVPSA